ncbi:MAG: glucose-1-phosphate cytidylyltransferase [Alphaproteobacteria bacterium]|nr:glucose-1-phosphate cytidylyltransferase [Alphaproteobacteria bacterium]
MKVLILAGGLGTRLGEETILKPKPMVEIGGQPILWHIMKIYSYYGFNDFVVLCGYKQQMIKRWFMDYYADHSDITVDLANNKLNIHTSKCEPWKVTLLDTGLNTLTGSRIKKAEKYIGQEPFMLTYGDGVSDIDINKLLEQHKQSGKLVTMTAIQPAGRFGVLEFGKDNSIIGFQEKPQAGGNWINGGFFVCEPDVLKYIPDDKNVMWEADPLHRLVEANQLEAYKHEGFWHPMDMLRDKELLNNLWDNNKAPWKKWED